MDHKETLHRYLKRHREDLVGKLDGLAEYDVRRPMTRTGTNLLGLVKHTASVQLEYFTVVFGRPAGRDLPWSADGAEPDADMWAPAEQAREEILDLHAFSAARADATIEALPLDAPGQVPWWPEDRREVSLQEILVRVIAETARHAGHADILRELIDGVAGQRQGDVMVSHRDEAGWTDLRERIEAAAQQARAGGQMQI
jgi:uncharacterized damage-inducible protein DinB